jgi:hypothetical protein
MTVDTGLHGVVATHVCVCDCNKLGMILAPWLAVIATSQKPLCVCNPPRMCVIATWLQCGCNSWLALIATAG